MLSNIFPYEFSDFCLQVRESNLKINHILQTKDPKNGHSLPGAFGPKKIKKNLELSAIYTVSNTLSQNK